MRHYSDDSGLTDVFELEIPVEMNSSRDLSPRILVTARLSIPTMVFDAELSADTT